MNIEPILSLYLVSFVPLLSDLQLNDLFSAVLKGYKYVTAKQLTSVKITSHLNYTVLPVMASQINS